MKTEGINHLDRLPKEILALILRFVGMKEGIKLSWVAQKYRQLYWDWIFKEFEAIESFDDSEKHQEIENVAWIKALAYDEEIFKSMLHKGFPVRFDQEILKNLEEKNKKNPSKVFNNIKKILRFEDFMKDRGSTIKLKDNEYLKPLFAITKNTKLSSGKTFLMYSIEFDHFDIFSYILSCDPDLSMQGKDKMNSLQYIMLYPKEDYFNLILDKFAQETKQNELLKFCMISSISYVNFAEYSEFLSSRIKEVLKRCPKSLGLSENKENDSILLMAIVQNNNFELFDALLEHKLDLNHRLTIEDKTMTILDLVNKECDKYLQIIAGISGVRIQKDNARNKLKIYNSMQDKLKQAGAKTSKELGM